MTAVHEFELMRPSVSLLKGAHVLCRSVLVTGAAGVNAGKEKGILLTLQGIVLDNMRPR